MKKLLLLIDCQYDFINGSLAVNGAPEAMDALAAYIAENGDSYAAIAATLDWHPYNHSSFKPFNEQGPWPVHCVQHTHGAAIYQPIIDAVGAKEIHHFTKGNNVLTEEYSIFANPVNGPALAKFITENEFEQIDVCGICGDYCVLNSLMGLVDNGFKHLINVLEQFTPSIDGGETLSNYLKNLKEE